MKSLNTGIVVYIFNLRRQKKSRSLSSRSVDRAISRTTRPRPSIIEHGVGVWHIPVPKCAGLKESCIKVGAWNHEGSL